MKNVQMTVDGSILTIQVDLSKEFGPSSSGKTIIVASTEGNRECPKRTSADEAQTGFGLPVRGDGLDPGRGGSKWVPAGSPACPGDE